MSLINSFTHIQENWKFVIICVQNQWGVVHPWHGTVANLWGRHKDFTGFNENFEKSYLLNGLSNIVKFFTVWFLKIFCIKWIHIFFWVQCSFKDVIRNRFNFILEERIKFSEQNSENLMKIGWIFFSRNSSWPVAMNMQMSELMMSSPHNFPFTLYTEMTKISYFS